MNKAAARSYSLFSACGFLMGVTVLGLGMAGCGGNGGGSRTGTGGGGSGGSSTGGGGSGGGAGGTTGLSCSPGFDPTVALLSDFSSTTWRAGAGKWGVVATGNLTGSIFAYKGTSTNTTWPTMPTVDTTAEDLTVMGMVDGGDYAGIGMSFDQCVNTTTWKGVSFTLGGTTGGCSVQLQVQTYEQQASSNKGGCVANADAGVSCYQFPKLTLSGSATTLGAFTVMWSDLAGTGMPTDPAAIAAEILGFQWQMVTNAPATDGGATQPQAPCTVNMTVDNVMFVTQAPPPVDAATTD